MRQSGEYRIGAAREAVWRALNDPEVLARCIDGCQSMSRTADDAFAASVKARIGPVSALFAAEVKLADLDPPRSYTIEVNVKGGAAGFGKGVAKVALSEDFAGRGAETLLSYEVEGQVGGKLAQVGQRLIDGAARKMADDFFAKFGAAVAPGATGSVPAPAPSAPVNRVGGAAVVFSLAGAALAIVILAAMVLHR